MSFIVKAKPKSPWPLAPEGVHLATLIEVKDMGMVESDFGPKHRARFTWEVAHNGAKYRVFQSFNVSMDPKAHLRRAIADILGRDPGGNFDLETLVGSTVPLVLGHDEGNNGITYANVRAILPPNRLAPPARTVEGGAR